jgi:creatinine amidohydrolase
MLLENCSYPEVEAYLEEKDTILVPIGSVEQHSPYGLIGTDFIDAEAVARVAGKKLGILVAPTICYGVSSHHMAFKGTVALQPDTLMSVLTDIAKSLVAHGFRRIIYVNGHGGNVNSLQASFERLKNDNVPGRFDVVSWYSSGEVQKLCKKFFKDNEGHHATPGEVSISRYLRPEAFEGKPDHEQEVARPKYYWPLTAGEMRRVFPDGRMESAPWLATAEHGAKILKAAAADLKKKIEAILKVKTL